jgi:ectoine hydroxylase-related dioxygenase (phytanoyl-CoA dioxygenase family)
MTTVADPEFDAQAQSIDAYFREGAMRARALGNRGPVRFTAAGKLAAEISDAYEELGFYIFENVVGEEELGELRAQLHTMLDRLPTGRESEVDHRGRPALGLGLPLSPFQWAKPLGDPLGGTATAKSRYPVKMIEARPVAGVPDEIVYIVMGPLQFSDAALRVYAHPTLLGISAAVNGDDFTPFSEGYIIKKPGEGAPFAWHQDGMTHWDRPDWDPLMHGFNFMVQLYPSTAANGVWFLPGTHKLGKLDIGAMIEENGGNLLPDAVPLICNAGDVALSNRQVLHSSFANTTDDWRVTLNLGCHRRSAVLGATGRTFNGLETYDDERIRKRAEIIGYAIDARAQHFPEERPFTYRPHAEAGETYRWNEAARAKIEAYYLRDLII